MRTVAEINELFQAMLAKKPEYRGDNFKFGQYMGKLEALSWMLGESRTGEMSREQDYEDWNKEAHQLNDDMEAGDL